MDTQGWEMNAIKTHDVKDTKSKKKVKRLFLQVFLVTAMQKQLLQKVII